MTTARFARLVVPVLVTMLAATVVAVGSAPAQGATSWDVAAQASTKGLTVSWAPPPLAEYVDHYVVWDSANYGGRHDCGAFREACGQDLAAGVTSAVVPAEAGAAVSGTVYVHYAFPADPPPFPDGFTPEVSDLGTHFVAVDFGTVAGVRRTNPVRKLTVRRAGTDGVRLAWRRALRGPRKVTGYRVSYTWTDIDGELEYPKHRVVVRTVKPSRRALVVRRLDEPPFAVGTATLTFVVDSMWARGDGGAYGRASVTPCSAGTDPTCATW